LIWLCLMVCLLVPAILAMGKAPDSSKAQKAIDFTLMDLNGRSHTLSEYKGKIVFLNFWASWCGPCRAEMPSMQKLYETWDKNKFEMLAVNLGEDEERVREFARENGYSFPILLEREEKVAEKYMIRGIPTTFLIDEHGNVIEKIVGTREWTLEELQGLIE
jgi:thiol-disulfide isomerase/thioredoxin